MKFLAKFTLFLSVGFLINQAAFAQTSVSDSLTTDQTWTLANSPYQVTANVIVNPGVTLTIEAGVTVQFDTGTSLIVDGAIVADGSAGNEVTFTSGAGSPAAGDWGTIRFNNTSGVGSVFDYVILEYGGGAGSGAMVTYRTGAFAFDITNAVFRHSAGHGIDLRASSPLIQNSEFRNNNGYGIFSDLGLSFEVDNSVVAENTTGGIRVPINSSPSIHDSRIDSNGVGIYIDNGAIPDIENNVIDGNNYGIVVIEAAGQSPNISDNTIRNSTTFGVDNRGTGLVTAEYNFWGDKSGPSNALNPTGNGDAVSNNIDFTPWLYGATLPVREITSNPVNGDVWSADSVYWVKNNITLGTGQTLTIQPGAVIKFADNIDFFIYGTLIADGTENDKIIFTSQYDDAIGGDSNGDGRATEPNRGNWRRIYLFDQSVNNVFDYVDIRYGGYSSSGNLYIDESTTSVTNTFVTNSNSYGIRVQKTLTAFNNNTANNNASAGFYIAAPVELKNLTAEFNNNHGMIIYAYTNGLVSIVGGNFSNNNFNGINFEGGGSYQQKIDSLVNVTASNNGRTGIDIGTNDSENFLAENLTIENNGWAGLQLFFRNRMQKNAVVRNSTFRGNSLDGLKTSSAQIYGNTFEDNQYGITIWGPLGHIYEDDLGNDGNTFNGNTYNNVLGLDGRALEDTLSSTFPENITSGAYMFNSYFYQNAVNANDTLVIEPGVIVKMSPNTRDLDSRQNGRDFKVYDGILVAEGTEENPIIFTSWRDDTAGGDTDALDDTVSAKPYDWDQLSITLTNSANHNTDESRIKHVELRYGGDGALYLSLNNTSLKNPIDHVKVTDAFYNGIQLDYGSYTITNSEVLDTERYHGIYARYGSTDLTVRNTIVKNSGRYGILAQGPNYNSFIREISNSIIEDNNWDGVHNSDVKAASTLLGNTIRNNGRSGVYYWHNSLDSTDVFFTGNIVENNANTGIISSAANFVDNQFNNNEFGIGLIGKLGHRYTDENGIDGNTFSGNTFNNVVALYGLGLKGTLSATFPEQVTSGAYMFNAYWYQNAVNTSDTLKIEPGVIVKMGYKTVDLDQRQNGRDFKIYDGLLLAEGTPENPIIFTSWRDDTAGGDTDAADDTVSARPYDWDQLSITLSNNAAYNTEESVLKYVELRYGGDGALTLSMNGTSLINPIDHVKVLDPFYNGMYLDHGKFTLTNSEVRNSRNSSGIYARYTGSDLTVRNSIIAGNAQYGVIANGISYNSFIREISNSIIENNGREGIYTERAKNPVTIQNNKVRNNARAGMYMNIDRSVTTDTVLTISGNVFENNDGPGFVSSRAIIVDDTLRGNKYPFGVTGELSRSGTVNERGNYYEGNVIENNEFDSLYIVTGTIHGVLGGSFPEGYKNKLILKEQITANVQVNSGDSLIIKPGVIIKNPADGRYGFYISGTFLVEGTEDEKVVFTSLRDDTFAGNTNNDTTGIQPAINNWSGIELWNPSTDSSYINNLIVRYAAKGLYLYDTDVVVDSTITSFNSSGIIVERGIPTIRYSDIHSNHSGLFVSNNGNPLIQLSNIYNNRDQGLYQAAGTNIMAENNFWGDPSGPFVNNGPDQNVNGQGDRINVASGTVDYRPYLVGRNGILLGDVTINGTISAFDASKILLHVVGLDILTGNNLAAGDVTGNGTVSSMDASLVLQYVVGIITGFPGQGKIIVPEPQNMLALDYEDSDAFTDITYNHKGGFDFYGAEMELILPAGTVDRVEWTNSAFSDHIELNYNQVGDTLRIAMASAKPIRKSGDLGDIRLIYSEESTASSISEQIKYHKFAANEVDLTEFVNENFTTSENETLIPDEFALNQNYPNPFNPSTNISYQLPADAKVQVQVYNMLGQLVQTLVDDNQKAGVYNLRWDASTFSSGTYLLRIDVVGSDNQNYSQIRKMLLIK
ncbi:MAG: right-handed parallel beta-helix repeat-containing protein [Balneolaceae bacterium]|nr:right-handed parallel beta-helix repeat-containing protein [Balneolaceae bacterium]